MLQNEPQHHYQLCVCVQVYNKLLKLNLKGFEEALREKERIIVPKVELYEEKKAEFELYAKLANYERELWEE